MSPSRPVSEAADAMMGDRVFVLALIIYAFLNAYEGDLDPSLNSALGAGKAWSVLDFGKGRKYRLTIEDER